MIRLDEYMGKRVRMAFSDGTALVGEPFQVVPDDELDSYFVYVIDGLSYYKNDTDIEVDCNYITEVKEM